MNWQKFLALLLFLAGIDSSIATTVPAVIGGQLLNTDVRTISIGGPTSIQCIGQFGCGFSIDGQNFFENYGGSAPITKSCSVSITAGGRGTFTDYGTFQVILTVINYANFTMNPGVHGTGSPASGRYAVGTALHLSATPESGWSFYSWSGDINSTANSVDLIFPGDFAVTPIFGAPINLDHPLHGTIVPSTNVSDLIVAGTPIDFFAIPDAGYYLSSWKGGAASAGALNVFNYVHTTPNVMISAEFLPLAATNVTLTATPPTNGNITIFSYRADLPATNKYALGATIFARAVPLPGYTFTGWSGDATGTENPIIITLDRSKRISANFEPGFSVTVNQTDGGVVNYSSRKTVYAAGTILDLQAVPAAGFEFAGWSGAVISTQKTIELTVNTNLTLFARFRAPLKQPGWEYQSPSSAVFDPVVDAQGQVYVLDRRGVVALDASGNLRWRTLTADGATKTNANLAVEPSGNLRVLSKAMQGGTSVNLQRLNPAGDLLANTLYVPTSRDGLAVSTDGVVYLGGRRATSVGASGVQWEFAGITSLEQSDPSATLSAPALDLAGNLYFAGAYSAASGGATHLFERTAANAFAVDKPLRAPLIAAGAGGPAVQDFTGATCIIDASPVIGTDHIYLVDFDGSLLAENLDGSFAWRFATLDVFAPPSIGADGAIYFGAKNSNRFYALNKDGTVRWIKRPGIGNYTIPAIGSDGTIYVSDSVGLYALDANGNREWEFDAATDSPVIAAGHVYAAGDLLYAFDAGAPGAATSPWPMRNASAPNNREALALPSAPQFDRASMSVAAGALGIRVLAQTGARVGLYASPDLIKWTLVSEQVAANGAVQFSDPPPTTGARFYRAQLQ